VILGGAAAAGVLASGVQAVLAAGAGELPPDRPATPVSGSGGAGQTGARSDAGSGNLWGTSPSGQGPGVRGNGRLGVVGEGTHTGVSGDGFIGVRGATSIVQGEERGVGVWAQATASGSTALRADGPSEFNGTTTFARSGAATVPRGSTSVTVTGVQLTDGTAILATLQNRVTGLFLHAVETDVTKGTFTIFLSAAPDRDVRIGWFALG
jgi:hypothetical protein